MRFILFLIFNFGALILGAFFVGGSPEKNVWFLNLHKAPWTPSILMFGLMWTIIMFAYSGYMILISRKIPRSNRKIIFKLYYAQLLLNIVYNPILFKFHSPFAAVVVLILMIIILVVQQMVAYNKTFASYLLIAPYIIWLFVELTLNLYITMYN